MPTTSSIGATYDQSTTIDPKNVSSSSVYHSIADMDFMNLLLTQLRYQDPMQPMGNSEMMTQMASLTTVQELQNLSQSIDKLNASSQFSYASSLVGKHVAYKDQDGNTISGKVDYVDISKSDNIILVSGDKEIPLSSVQYIAPGD